MAVALCLVVTAVARIVVDGEPVAGAAPDFSLEVDTDPAANTGDSLGPTEFCRQVSVGQNFQVDIVAKDAPPLFGVEVSLRYDPAVLRITAIQVDSGLFLGKKLGSSTFSFSNPTPDEDGDYRAAAADFKNTGPSGSGTIFRLTLVAKVAGISPLQIPADDPSTFYFEGPVVPDTNNNPLTPLLSGGEIRVGQQEPCPASGPPPIEPPEPPPDAGNLPTPNPEGTPGETGGTPQATAGTPETELANNVAAGDSDLPVKDSTVFQPGDIVQVDDEKMRVISISDNLLRVERGVEGTEAEGLY